MVEKLLEEEEHRCLVLFHTKLLYGATGNPSKVDQDNGRVESVKRACICTILIVASCGVGSKPSFTIYFSGGPSVRYCSLQPQFPHYQMR